MYAIRMELQLSGEITVYHVFSIIKYFIPNTNAESTTTGSFANDACMMTGTFKRIIS